jgi:hypothetical protein
VRLISRLAAWVCMLAIAVSAPSFGQEERVWYWFSNCGAVKLDLEVSLAGKLVYSSAIPICRAERDSDASTGHSRALSFQIKPSRPLKWEGYRDDEPITRAGQALTVDVWQAGTDPGALLMGVSVSDRRQIYMNTLHIAYPDKQSSTTVADGFVVSTRPQR